MTADVHTQPAGVVVCYWWRINDSGRREQGRLIKRGQAWEVHHDGREPVQRPTETAALVEVERIIGNAWKLVTVNPERRKRPARAS